MTLSVVASGTFDIPDLGPVHRLGFGAMRITGPGIWGEPPDREVARQVVRRAVELGVDFIDTADSYGPTISEEIIAEAIHPYGEVKIATKAGFTRQGPHKWIALGRPEYLRQQAELSLRRLRVDRLDVLQLHRIDPTVDRDVQFGVLSDLHREGKVAALSVSGQRRGDRSRLRSLSGSNSSKSLQPDRPQLGRRTGLLRGQWHRVHSVGAGVCRQADRGWFAAGECSAAARRQPSAGRARLAASPVTGDAAHSGNRLAGTSRGEYCRRGTPT